MALSLFPEGRGGLRYLCFSCSVLKPLNTAKNTLLVPWQCDSHLRQVPVEEEGRA
jgi:hypothetical protein